MVRSLFENSNRKLRSTFWGSPLILVGTNQAECCLYHLPISRFLLGSRLALHKFAPFLESNCNGCGNSVVNWKIANHYAFDTPTGFFCQIGKHLGLQIRVWNLPDSCRSLQCLVDWLSVNEISNVLRSLSYLTFNIERFLRNLSMPL